MNRRLILAGGGTLVAAGALGGGFVRMGSADDYDRATAEQRRTLDIQPGSNLRELVRYGTLAANGHNTQPWQFRLSDHAIRIEPDFTRATPVVDPDHHHLFISLGCAAENLVLAAAAAGLEADVSVRGEAIEVTLSPGEVRQSALFAAIPDRQSTRALYDGRAVPKQELGLLAGAAAEQGVQAVILSDRNDIARLRDLVVAGTEAQMADPDFVAELKSWIRFNPAAALAAGDGIFSGASGNPSLPSWIGGTFFGLLVTAKAESARYAAQMDSSSGAMVLAGDTSGPAAWIAVGRACQRFALQATALGIAHTFMNQPVEVGGLRAELSSLAGLEGRRPDIVMRFGYGPKLPRSPRRPLEQVIA